MHKKLLATLLLTCSFSTIAMAGGYQLQEYSIVNLGRAFGGAGVAGDDYSAVAFNPAGMMLKNTGVQLGSSFVAIRAHGDGVLRSAANSDMIVSGGKGKLRTNALLPHFFGQIKAGEKLRIGGGVYVPFGLGTYYKKNWFGNTHALNSEITAIDAALAGAYQLTDTVSVGASAFMEYADARLTSSTAAPLESDLNADGWKPGFSVGVMYQPQKETRLGVSYRSKVHHDIKGPHYFNLPVGSYTGDCGTSLTFPEHVLISGYQDLGKFGLSAVARWTRWSQFNKLNIHSDAYRKSPISGGSPNLPTVDEDWKNVWTIGGGVDYHYNQNWT